MLHTKHIINRIKVLSLLAGLGFASFLGGASLALSATAPSLGTTGTYGVVSSTFTNSSGGSTINGDVCYTTGPAVAPTINGVTVVPCPGSTGTDQGNARAILLGQPCIPLGAAVALDAVIIGANPPGTFPPGCYSSTGAMSVTTGTTVTLSGSGVFIFRPGGALNTAANSSVVAAAGACASDVFWAPLGATTLGANTNFVGNILAPAADITIGSTTNFEGRALAYGQTVTIDTDTISVPACTPAAATPDVVTNASSAVALGGAISDIATLSGGSAPTGNIIFNLYGPNDGNCAGAVIFTSTVPVNGNGQYSSASFTPAIAGTYRWIANYGGDANNAATINACNAANETVDVTSSVSPTTVPTLNEWGVILFMLLAGAGSVYYLKKYRRV